MFLNFNIMIINQMITYNDFELISIHNTIIIEIIYIFNEVPQL